MAWRDWLDRLRGRGGLRLGSVASRVDGVWVLEPAVFYPAMVAYVRGAVEQEGLPEELVDRRPKAGVDAEVAARRYVAWARGLPEQAWADALGGPAEEGWEVMRRVNRADALECCRLWFTRAAKNGQEGVTRIRILADERYRLGV